MERLVEWNCKEKGSALPKSINEFGDTVLMEDICAQLATIYDILGDDYNLHRLRELVEAEKRDMFISVPCKVGDVVYVVTSKFGCRLAGKEIVTCHVNSTRVKSDGVTIGYSCRGKYSNGNSYIGNFVFKSIGKTVFLTRESAEAKLKELKQS